MKFIVATVAGLVLLICLPGSCFLSPVSSSSDPCLIIVGGGNIPGELKREFVRRSRGRIIVIPNASERKEAGQEEVDLWEKEMANIKWQKSKFDNCRLPIVTLYTQPKDIRNTNGVWIGGGDQRRLNLMKERQRIIWELKDLLRRGGIVGGTSAGASILGEVMPFEDGEELGFGLLNDVVIDQHFVVRKRLGRLQKIVNNHSGYRGYGIDEDAGMMVVGGRIRFYGQIVVLR